MSKSTGSVPLPVGMPIAMGFVPNMASVAPCGATYSGDCAITKPINPLLAIFSAKYLSQKRYY